MKLTCKIFLVISFGLLSNSCNKEMLDKKPDKALVVPTTLQDFQALLDNTSIFNGTTSSGLSPYLGEVGADNYFLKLSNWQTAAPLTKNAYIWAKSVYDGVISVPDWNLPYQSVFYSNVVLEGLSKLARNSQNQNAWDNIKGSALFYRAYAFYDLAQIFAKPYNQTSAVSDLGILLKLNSDINETSERSSIEQTYSQIIGDLLIAKDLLPLTPLHKTRPSRPAALAMLARCYLAMNDYENAFKYADSCLSMYSTLINFNTDLRTSGTYLISRFNPEVVYHTTMGIATVLTSSSSGNINAELLQSFAARDLRLKAFFRTVSGVTSFRGSYFGGVLLFSGLAVDEIYLTRAECYARKGNTQLAMDDLNKLLEKRWETGYFVPVTAVNSEEALNKILIERRKELCFRGIRWTDLRRLNSEVKLADTLVRSLGSETHVLLPNDIKYVYPIPETEIRLNNLQQNPR